MAWQVRERLAMTGLGTTGGEPQDAGSVTAAGVHLRWSFDPAMGFPAGGFEIFRRPSPQLEWSCLDLGPLGSRPAAFTVGNLAFTATPGTFVHDASICGPTGGFRLDGPQEVVISFATPMSTVRVRLGAPAGPGVVLYGEVLRDGEPLAVVAAQAPGGTGTVERVLSADRIDQVRLLGADFSFCQVCTKPIPELTTGWGAPITPIPRQLPVTRAGWPGVHANTPNDIAEATARLAAAALPAPTQASYLAAFTGELHPLLYALVGFFDQMEARTGGPGVRAGPPSDRRAPDAKFRNMHLLQLLSADVVMARLLGLYWLDNPGAGRWDYRVVGHWGSRRWPGTVVDIPPRLVGVTATGPRTVDAVTLASPRPIHFEEFPWSGQPRTCARVDPALGIDAPFAVRVTPGTQSLTLWVQSTAAVTVRWYRDGAFVSSIATPPGERVVDIDNAAGISAVTLDGPNSLRLFRVVVREAAGTIGDMNYVSLGHDPGVPSPLPNLSMAQAISRTVPTRSSTASQDVAPTAVLLSWARPGFTRWVASRDAPVRARARREERGTGSTPGTVTATLDVTTQPLAVRPGRREESGTARLGGWGEEQAIATDWGVPDGWHDYRVRGIDLFGRVSPWSPPLTAHVLHKARPLPPIAAAARWIETGDRWLDASDTAWVTTNGSGLVVRWSWPGEARLAAPAVEGSGEFRVYWEPSRFNEHHGTVTSVVDGGVQSTLTTTWSWSGANDALAGLKVRLANTWFTIASHSAGANVTFTVENLTAPHAAPEPGTFVIGVPSSHAVWEDTQAPTSFEQRLHVEPAGTIPIVQGAVTAVSASGGAWSATTDQTLAADPTLMAGVVVCRGMVYRVSAHHLGASNVVLDGADLLLPDDTFSRPVIGDAFTYYPGRSYEIRVAGMTFSPAPGDPTAAGTVVVTSSDNAAHTPDEPAWSDPGRGGLGARPGNESGASRPSIVLSTRRTAPAEPMVSSTSDWVQADPADYHGDASVSLEWTASADAAGYHLYRATTARLFAVDSGNRQEGAAYYEGIDVFADDTGFDDWLAEAFPWLTESDLFGSLDAWNGSTLRLAWRKWSSRFYASLTYADIRALAARSGNNEAFERVTTTPVGATTVELSLPGRGAGAYVYRVTAVDASLNESSLADAPVLPIVVIRDVTPPPIPRIVDARGGENTASLRWRRSGAPDIATYQIWRGASSDALADVRRLTPTDTVTATADDAPLLTWEDTGLSGPATWYYRLAAMDSAGNVSEASPVVAVGVMDSTPPAPPAWERAEWVELDASGTEYPWGTLSTPDDTGIALQWLAEEADLVCTLLRRADDERPFTVVVRGLVPVDATDPDAEDARRFEYRDLAVDSARVYQYRVQAVDLAGNRNIARFNQTRVDTPS